MKENLEEQDYVIRMWESAKEFPAFYNAAILIPREKIKDMKAADMILFLEEYGAITWPLSHPYVKKMFECMGVYPKSEAPVSLHEVARALGKSHVEQIYREYETLCGLLKLFWPVTKQLNR